MKNKSQNGATLFIGLILLLAISIVSLAAMRTSVLDLIIANNKQQFAYTFEAAEEVINERLTTMNLSLTGVTPVGNVLPGTNQSKVINRAGTAVKLADVNSNVVYRGEGSALGWGLGTRPAYHFQLDVNADAPGRGASANHRIGFFIP